MKKLVALVLACTPTLALASRIYNDGAGGAWDCAKDPDVVINVEDATFTFSGTCKTITVNGGHNTITAAAIRAITLNGEGNTVRYGGDKPRAIINGEGNTLAPTGGAAGSGSGSGSGGGGAAPAPTGGARGGAGVIDCAAQPTYVVDGKGKQALRFAGTCEAITVETGHNDLAIDNVKTLRLDGGMNKVQVGGVDAIITNGAKNQIVYRGGLTGPTTKRSGAGAGNRIVKAP